MGDLLNYFINLLKELPTWVQLIVIPLVLFMLFLIRNKTFRNNFILLMKRLFSSVNKKGLLTDDIFMKYKQYLRDISYFSFGNQFKDDLFRSLLEIKINTVVDKLRSFLKNDCNKHISKYELHTKCFDLVTDMINDYESKYKQVLTKKYGEDNIDELYDYIIGSFSKYHKKNVDVLDEQLTAISNSDFLKNNYQRLSYFTFQVHVALRNGIMDAEKAFKAFNGTLVAIEDKILKKDIK